MDNLVEVKNGKIFANSLRIAEYFGKRHDNVIASIENLPADDFTLLNFKVSEYVDESGKSNKMYLLTRDSFSLIVMGFTGEKAYEWKLKYIKAFNIMEQKLLNKQNQEWVTSRKQGKLARKEETDTIHDFIEYTRDQGSSYAQWYYKNFTDSTYKALSLLEQRKPKTRDTLNMLELNQLLVAESIVTKVIQRGMDEELGYKDIFKEAKAALEKFAESVLILN